MLACTWCWGRNRGPRPVVCSPQQASLKVHRLPLDSRCMMPENLLCSTFTAATRKQCERYEESRCQSLHDQNTSLSLHIAPDHRREHVTSGTSQRSLASSGTSPASSSRDQAMPLAALSAVSEPGFQLLVPSASRALNG